MDFSFIQELYSASTILDQEGCRDKRQPAAKDDPLCHIRDDVSFEQDGEQLDHFSPGFICVASFFLILSACQKYTASHSF
jgi:hypothetical protein